MVSGPGYGPEYQSFKRWLMSSDVVCHHCGRERATTPDHNPPFDMFESEAAWKQAGGELLPACDRCNKSRGAKYVNAKRRVYTGKTVRSAVRYPASSW